MAAGSMVAAGHELVVVGAHFVLLALKPLVFPAGRLGLVPKSAGAVAKGSALDRSPFRSIAGCKQLCQLQRGSSPRALITCRFRFAARYATKGFLSLSLPVSSDVLSGCLSPSGMPRMNSLTICRWPIKGLNRAFWGSKRC
jgi:hypothetical protein